MEAEWAHYDSGALEWSMRVRVGDRWFGVTRRIPSHVEPTEDRKRSEELMGLRTLVADMAFHLSHGALRK